MKYLLGGLLLGVAAVGTGAAALQAAEPGTGEAIYRSNCGFCHGTSGEGGRGSKLNVKLTNANNIEGVKSIISKGIPGTSMPSFRFTKEDLQSLADHVWSLSKGKASETVKLLGDPKAGEAVYARSGCISCHRVGEKGSDYGPELTRVGGARSVEYLKASVVNPDADVPPQWVGAKVTQKDGKTVKGHRINEDTFSVQLRGVDMKFQMFMKDEVASVEPMKESLMPAYAKLKEKDLNDLVAYMQTLKGQVTSGDTVKAKGIH
jgi:cytochrome c oxidase cbb3-type subunit III